jgi:hypothetical protein
MDEKKNKKRRNKQHKGTPVMWSMAYNSAEEWPFDNTKRSLFA